MWERDCECSQSDLDHYYISLQNPKTIPEANPTVITSKIPDEIMAIIQEVEYKRPDLETGKKKYDSTFQNTLETASESEELCPECGKHLAWNEVRSEPPGK